MTSDKGPWGEVLKNTPGETLGRTIETIGKEASKEAVDMLKSTNGRVGANTTSWLGKLGSVLSGVGNLVQLGVAGGLGNLGKTSQRFQIVHDS